MWAVLGVSEGVPALPTRAAALLGGCFLQILQEELGFTSCPKEGRSIPGRKYEEKQRRAFDSFRDSSHVRGGSLHELG